MCTTHPVGSGRAPAVGLGFGRRRGGAVHSPATSAHSVRATTVHCLRGRPALSLRALTTAMTSPRRFVGTSRPNWTTCPAAPATGMTHADPVVSQAPGAGAPTWAEMWPAHGVATVRIGDGRRRTSWLARCPDGIGPSGHRAIGSDDRDLVGGSLIDYLVLDRLEQRTDRPRSGPVSRPAVSY